MKTKRFWIVLLLILVVTSLALADEDTDIDCLNDLDCDDWLADENEPGTYYCSEETQTCMIYDTPPTLQKTTNATQGATKNKTTTKTQPKIVTTTGTLDLIAKNQQAVLKTQKDITSLKGQLNAAEKKLTGLQSDLTNLGREVSSTKSSSQTVKQAQDKSVKEFKGELRTLATGLAAVQTDVAEAQTNLTALQQEIHETESKRTFRSIILWIAIIAAVGAGVVYFKTHKKLLAKAAGKLTGKFGGSKGPKIHPEIVNYITSHIKKGNKYPHVKQQLLKAGWSAQDIDWAYQSTIHHNYNKYLQTKKPDIKHPYAPPEKTGGESPARSEKFDKKKVLIISIVGVVVLIGALFALKGSTGRAYYSYGGVEDYEESVPIDTSPKCFPPEIMNAQGVCCLDVNSNNICDNSEVLEEEVVRVVEARDVACDFNSQCLYGKQCIDGVCKYVAELYNTECTTLACNPLRVKLSTEHANFADAGVENYTLPLGRGSYTGAGALEWTLLKVPDYCNEQGRAPAEWDVPIPILITRKHNSEIMDERVITLNIAEESESFEHPHADLHGFRIKVNDLFHSCGQPIFQ